MAIIEGSAFAAVCVPPRDWSRGGKGGGCLLFLASCWVEATPCRGDVIPIVTCRDVSGYADEHVVNIHEGDRVIIQLCSTQERILSYSRCSLLAWWLFYDVGGASASRQGDGRVDDTCESARNANWSTLA
jgi:hypothetical protein